jgi:serine/threonine protein kinase
MEPAKRMFGKYKEIDLIGRGSSGVVYKVEEVEEDGDVHVYALKKFEVAPENSKRDKKKAL